MFLLSWLVFPLVLAMLSLGAGLLIARAGRQWMPRTLLLPVGFAGLITVSALLTYFDATAELAAPALVLVAALGFVLGRRSVANLPHGADLLYPAIAVMLPLTAVAAPVVLTGQAGFTGYGRIVDLAFQMELASWFVEHGRALPRVDDSSYTNLITKTVGIGYPGGAQATIGATTSVVGLDPIWGWQPFMAWISGLLGLSLFAVLRNAVRHPFARAVAAGVAAQATITYSYALAGGIKELAAALAVGLVAALLMVHRPGDRRLIDIVPLAVVMAAGFAVLNVGILPWVGIAALVWFVQDLRSHRSSATVIGRWSAVAIASGAFAAPALVAAASIAGVAASGGPTDLGNLAAPVPAHAAVGVWLTPDHRFPLEAAGHETLTNILIVAVAILAALGMFRALARRDLGPVAGGAAAVVALVYVVWQAAAWSELKAITISAPFVVALAFAGASAVRWPRSPRWLQVAAGALVAAAVLGGNMLIYQGTTLAPYERLSELERIGKRYADKGPALYPAFEEYAEHLLRDARGSGLVNPAGGDLGLRPGGPPDLPPVIDPDRFRFEYLQRFRLIVQRRDPTASRPPSNWRLAEQTSYYNVWQRRPDADTVVAHIPLEGKPGERSPQRCRRIVSRLRQGGEDARLAYVRSPDVVQVSGDPAAARGRRLQRGPDFLARGPMTINTSAALPYDGRWSIWLRGSVGRTVSVVVDDREVGDVRWAQSYPLQYEPVTTLELSAGEHRVTLLRGGGSLLPGTGNDLEDVATTTTIGPIAFAPAGEKWNVEYAGIDRAAAVCNGDVRLDWMEIVLGS